mgnify:CR=1 FL=1
MKTRKTPGWSQAPLRPLDAGVPGSDLGGVPSWRPGFGLIMELDLAFEVADWGLTA